MRRNVGSEKDTAYGGTERHAADLTSILPPGAPEERPAVEAPPGSDELIGVTVDGVAVRVPRGSTVFEAAEAAGYTPPHFCFHRDLSIPANCRMCLCEIEGVGKLQTSCSAAVADGMEVRFDTPRVSEAVQGVLEFEFKNHPLDCPVCDQVGECYLQRYFLEVGKYDPQPIQRVRKDKVKDIGPITLDAERCVLCSRCVRFGNEVAGTGDFVIANRSDQAQIMTFDDRPLTTPYALNYADICPVGALTSNDFRFRKRTYYLKTAKSICPECSTGCNIYVEQAEDVVYRYRPRYNDDVNDSWMCDPGRLSHTRSADTSDRLVAPSLKRAGGWAEIRWEEALDKAAEALSNLGGSVAGLAHPQMTNEDLFALAALTKAAGGEHVEFRVDDSWHGVDDLIDGILIRRDPNPNTRGALEILGVSGSESGVPDILAAVESGSIRGLIVCHWTMEALGDAGRRALESAEWVCFLGPRVVDVVDHADLVLPTSIHVERDGTYTNHAGRVQRFRRSVSPHEESRPAWKILSGIAARAGGAEAPSDAADAFDRLAEEIPAFTGMSHDSIGDAGAWLTGWGQEDPPPVGMNPMPGVRAPNIG